jgi:hypothetical protein
MFMLMTLLSNRENLRLDQGMAGFKVLACKQGISQKGCLAMPILGADLA